MNGLEIAVRPIIEKMSVGTHAISDLAMDEQIVIRKWAFKTALATLEASLLQGKALPTGLYRALARSQSVPESVHVIGVHTGGEPAFGFWIGSRVSLLAGAEDEMPGVEGLGETFTFVMQFGHTALALVYCEAPKHVLVLDQATHWPVGRPLSDYSWCVHRRRIAPFVNDEQFWEDLARGIYIAAEHPVGIDVMVIGGVDYHVVGPPDPRRRRNPPPVPAPSAGFKSPAVRHPSNGSPNRIVDSAPTLPAWCARTAMESLR